ncbi:hypothetical protein GX50_08551 [[Emmonsia] crescens]|uniref:Uncharacterized protein n=1 Tax=[Emmonsia] crescens TaxID=73230 RepID=A0A2B7Z537_9EURO|nr:hypothetical protein GX50_08551 [Emmonsia crescens]
MSTIPPPFILFQFPFSASATAATPTSGGLGQDEMAMKTSSGGKSVPGVADSTHNNNDRERCSKATVAVRRYARQQWMGRQGERHQLAQGGQAIGQAVKIEFEFELGACCASDDDGFNWVGWGGSEKRLSI